MFKNNVQIMLGNSVSLSLASRMDLFLIFENSSNITYLLSFDNSPILKSVQGSHSVVSLH